jgi:hypothetical protein
VSAQGITPTALFGLQSRSPSQDDQVPVAAQLPHPLDIARALVGSKVDLPPFDQWPPPGAIDHGMPVRHALVIDDATEDAQPAGADLVRLRETPRLSGCRDVGG